MTICCEHNPCPARPRWFLGKYATRPWRCPQCGVWWVTRPKYAYWPDYDWQWVRLPVEPIGEVEGEA